MWNYEKKLQYPVKIKNPNAAYAKVIISQLGGPDGELAAAMRYLNQRYTATYNEIIGILTDVGTEELAHLEMIGAILYQLTKGLSPEEIRRAGMDAYFVDHTAGIYPASAAGVIHFVFFASAIRAFNFHSITTSCIPNQQGCIRLCIPQRNCRPHSNYSKPRRPQFPA